MEPVSDKDQLEMATLAYNNNNYDDAYQITNQLLLSTNDPLIRKKCWELKALSAGSLSTPQKNRLSEMISYLNEARKVGGSFTDNKWIAMEVSDIASWLSGVLIEHYGSHNSQVASSRVPTTVTVYSPKEGIGESIGRGIGQGIANASIESRERKKATVESGKHFMQEHLEPISNAIAYAYNLSSDKTVGEKIGKAVNNLINTNALSPLAQRKFSARNDDITGEIVTDHHDLTIYVMNAPEKLTCPNCGYVAAKSAKSGMGIGWHIFFTIITFGWYLGLVILYLGFKVFFDLFREPEGMTQAREGQELICEVCSHQWKHKG